VCPGLCEITRTLAGGSQSRKVLCLFDDEGRKARSTEDRLASSSTFHIMHYVRDITSNETIRKSTQYHRSMTPCSMRFLIYQCRTSINRL